MKLVFATGGTKSGKSDFMQKYAESVPGKRTYVATGIAMDKEMEERIKKHQRKRDEKWHTLIEEPYDIKTIILELNSNTDVALVDSITVWIGNLLYKFNDNIDNVNEEINGFLDNLKRINYNLFIVSDEVGMGIVPENKLSRIFRDILGETNQKIAKISDEFYTCFSGYTLRLK